MPYLLRFTGGASPAGYIAHPAALSGASTFDVEIDFVPRSISAGYAAVYSNNSSDLNNRHAMYVWGSSRCEIAFIIGGVRRVLNAPVGTFTVGTRYKVNATYDGSTFRILVNGSSVASVAASGTVGGSGGLVWIGANTTETRAAIDLYGYKITENGTLIRFYNPANTSSGTVLPDDVNSANNGNQAGTWPANDAEWIFYSSGAAYADTLLAGSYSHSGSLLNSSVGYSSLLQAGSFAHSGGALSSTIARSSVLLAGSYTYSGSALGSAVGYSSTLQGGAFSYSGSELQSIISNGAQNYSDTLLGGSFTHSGSALQSSAARNSTLLAGSYSHSGSNLTASLAFYSTLNGGAYSHFGSMLQSTVSGQVTVSIEGYTITFAADDVSGAFAADMVGGSYQSDYIEAIKWLT